MVGIIPPLFGYRRFCSCFLRLRFIGREFFRFGYRFFKGDAVIKDIQRFLYDRIFDCLEFLVLRQRNALFRRILISSGYGVPLLVPQIIQRRDIFFLCKLIDNSVHNIPSCLRQISVNLFALMMRHLLGELQKQVGDDGIIIAAGVDAGDDIR